MDTQLIILFPTQLFEEHYINKIFDSNKTKSDKKCIIIWEHEYFFDRYKYHKLKLVFHRSSMQKYYDDLSNKYTKMYIENNDNSRKEILNFIKKNKVSSINFFNPIEKDLINKINKKELIKKCTIEHIMYPTPYFLNGSSFEVNDKIESTITSTRHDIFYKNQRIIYNIMVKKNKDKFIPEGNKWSFDTENRKPFEKDQKEIELIKFKNKERKEYVKEAIKYINKNYKNNYGTCEEENFIYPIDREESLKWLDNFIKNKLDNFGKYEDAISYKIKFGYHSLLSGLTNVGLITTYDILEKVEKYNKNIASKEGFIRQIIGWREYCYYIYDKHENDLLKKLFYDKNKNKIPNNFWLGKTQIPIIDNIINNINKYAYSHHIERLMCIGVYLLFIGVSIEQIYIWFQTMYIDAYDVFMIPNVYGMLCYGYINEKDHMMTKPYFSSSNYIKKMLQKTSKETNEENKVDNEIKLGNKIYKWDEIYDSLYYNHINNYSDKMGKIYSTAMMVKRWKNFSEEIRKDHIKVATLYIKSLF